MGVNDFFEGTLEITTNVLKKGCTVACKICPQELLVNSYHPLQNINLLSFEAFVTMLNKVPKTYRIDFAGYTEPFLNKDCIKMMKHATDAGYRICCYTTLVGASLEDVEVLAKLPFSQAYCCPLVIHLPDKNEVMPIKITKKYREVLERFVALTKDLPSVGFMTMDASGDVHPDLYDLVGKLRGFQPISRADSLDNSKNIDRVSGKDPDDEPRPRKNITRLNGRIRCKPMPKLNHNMLMPNGNIQLCCMDYGLKHTLGNLLKSDHASLFQSDVFKEIQRSMLNDPGESSDDILCRNCELAQPC